MLLHAACVGKWSLMMVQPLRNQHKSPFINYHSLNMTICKFVKYQANLQKTPWWSQSWTVTILTIIDHLSTIINHQIPYDSLMSPMVPPDFTLQFRRGFDVAAATCTGPENRSGLHGVQGVPRQLDQADDGRDGEMWRLVKQLAIHGDNDQQP